MKHFLIFISAILLSACEMQLPDGDIRVINTALQYKDLHEEDDNQQLQEYLGIDPSQTEWCAAFVNNVLDESDIPSLESEGYEYPLLAKGYFNWGYRVDKTEIQIGDVVVFPRVDGDSWQGHVGFFMGTTWDGWWNILGGNQNDKVGINRYKPQDALQVRRHPEMENTFATTSLDLPQ